MAPMDITTQKQQARAWALAQRDAISPCDKDAKSAAICAKLNHALDDALDDGIMLGGTQSANEPFTVAVYAAFQNEVRLDAFIRYAYSRGCRMAFPCMNREPIDGLSMVMRAVDGESFNVCAVPFVSSPIEAFEPDDECVCDYPIVDPKSIDMLVVPMVAFDAEGMRLGYGGGNYDTFMPRLAGHTRIVGVAFAEQQIDSVPFDYHDRRIDRIITA